jgi:hypothetical protein
MKGRDPKTNIEPRRNLLVDLNAIDLTLMNLMSPMVGAYYRGL